MAKSQPLILIELKVLLRNNINRHVIDVGDGYFQDQVVVECHHAAIALLFGFLADEEIDSAVAQELDVFFDIIVADEQDIFQRFFLHEAGDGKDP